MLMATQAVEVDASKAIILPPPGGPRVVTVIQTNYDNGIMQRIVLGADSHAIGENAITVRLYGPIGGNTGNTLSNDSPDAHSIGVEMVSAFPNVSMQISTFYAQNFYGPFGYAVGRTKGGTCLYGWQIISAPKNHLMVPSSPGQVTVRLRICATGATEESLLAYMYGYTVNAFFVSPNWNPFGPPPAVPATLGASGAPSLPVPQGSNPYYSSAAADPRMGRVVPVGGNTAPSSAPRRQRATTTTPAHPAAAGPPPVLQNPSVLPGLGTTPSAGNAAGSDMSTAAPSAGTGGAPIVPSPSDTSSATDSTATTVRVVGAPVVPSPSAAGSDAASP